MRGRSWPSPTSTARWWAGPVSRPTISWPSSPQRRLDRAGEARLSATMTTGRLVFFLAAAAVVAVAQARAAPLDADTCAKLRGEHSQLELAGVEKDMEKGPEWAKANLAADKLDRIRRFIDLEEQLLFRCRDKSLVSLPAEQEQTPNADNGEQDKKGEPDKKGEQDKKSAPAAVKKPKTPDAAKTKSDKKTEPAKKAAVQPKPATTVPKQTKPDAGAATVKPAPKAAVKPPTDPAPPAPVGKAAPKAKTEEQ